MAEFDWDRERREARARAHGRERAYHALASGVGEVRKRWRATGARSIWVQPLVDKAALVVLLPRESVAGEGEWRLVFSTARRTEERSASADRDRALYFTPVGTWGLQVWLTDDGGEWLEAELDDYYPDPRFVPFGQAS